MNIVCSSSVLKGEEAFIQFGKVTVIPEAEISAEDLVDTDILITRSKIKVDEALLKDSPISFYGTATAGFDHVDTAYLESRKCHFAVAPGCNANSVSEYITAALLHLATQHNFVLEDKVIGIVGNGNTGSEVANKARALGMEVLLNDPPKALTDAENEYVSLEELVANSDIISLHIPLVTDGEHPTDNLLSAEILARTLAGSILINACRGEVNDQDKNVALKKAVIFWAVVTDVWGPEINKELMEVSDIATPHIAGHSYTGKLNGTVMLYDDCCHFLGRVPQWNYDTYMNSIMHRISISLESNEQLILQNLISKTYDILKDDLSFREGLKLNDTERMALFKKIRGNYPIRHEFNRTEVAMNSLSEHLKTTIESLGFSTHH